MTFPAPSPTESVSTGSTLASPFSNPGLVPSALDHLAQLGLSSHQLARLLDSPLADHLLTFLSSSDADSNGAIAPHSAFPGSSQGFNWASAPPLPNGVDGLTGQTPGSVQVGGGSVNPHDSAITPPRLGTAEKLGVIAGAKRVDGTLIGDDLTNFYEIKLHRTSQLNVTLKQLTADADLYLIQDANRNGLVDRGEVLYVSNTAGRATERLNIKGLTAGKYYIQVAQEGGATDYALTLNATRTEPGVAPTQSADLGILKGRGSTTGTVTPTDQEDLYRFRLDSTSDLNLRLSGLSSNANLYLIQDRNNNGQIDTSDILAQSRRIGPAPEGIRVEGLTAGTYFALVDQRAGTTNYTLTWTVDAAGEEMGSAQNLGFLNGNRTVVDFVGEPDPVDFYQFSLSAPQTVTLKLDQLTADADLYVVRDMNGNGRVDEDEAIATSLNSGTTAETITLEGLAAGNYVVYVNEYDSSTNYRLSLDTQTGGGTGIRTVSGTFGADTFTYTSGYQYTIISGNGNLDFGAGYRDLLNLSNLASHQVTLNLADANGGGVVFNPGNGARLFDAITLSDGSQILFEGIDTLQFSDTVMNLSVMPNDPLFNQQWNLHMMGVQNAWRFSTGSASDVLVGVQDTGLGVDWDGAIHPDLASTLIYSGNYEDETRDQLSHGTAVQSIIAAATNNGYGMSGINWNSEVYALDVISGGDWGDFGLGNATQLMVAMADQSNQRLVVNMSLSGGGDPLFEQLIAANQDDVLFVIASGNEDRNSISYPSAIANTYDNVMAIGASWGAYDYYGNPTTPGTRISYAGWWGSNYGTGLSLMGPSEVVAADATTQAWSGTSFDYSFNFNGTSAATPNVAGVASLVWSANPLLSATQVHQILAATAVDLGTPGYDEVYGSGFVNADAAVRMALAMA